MESQIKITNETNILLEKIIELFKRNNDLLETIINEQKSLNEQKNLYYTSIMNAREETPKYKKFD